MRDLQLTSQRLGARSRRSRHASAASPVPTGAVMRKPSCACGGGCPRCAAAEQGLQRKPSISSPGDAHEREADAIADHVMRDAGPVPAPTRAAATQAGAAAPALDAELAARTAERGGSPLPSELRAYFEPRFGRDLGAVRVHADGAAAEAAQAVQARAYTFGRDIVFGAGQFAPGTDQGKHLLAHELAHVVQQGGAAESMTDDEPALHRQPTDEEPKKEAKPLIPIPVFDKFDVVPYGPAPGATAPTPFDPRGSDPAGKGPSMEDIHGGAQSLFGKKPLNLGLNYNTTMPSCSMLEAFNSTKENRRYHTFEQYDLDRKVFHGPDSKDPWPVLDRDSYNQAIGACPKSEAPMTKPDFPREKPLLQDAPERTLPEGQAYA